MKKRILYMLILMTLGIMVACSKRNGSQNDSPQKSGFAKRMGAISPESTDDGVYLFSLIDSDLGILSYWNLTSETCVPLCSKANCTHTDETCDAWFKEPNYGTLQKYEDKIYLWCGFQGSLALYSENLDGTERKKVCGFSAEDRTGNWVDSSVVSGDFCYINMSFGQDRKGSDIRGIYRISLTNGTAKLIRMNNEDADWTEHRLDDVVYDNGKVYYKITEYRTGEARSRVFEYNPISETDTVIFETDAVISHIIAENKLYYTKYETDKDKVFVVDLKTGSETSFLVPFAGYLTYDGTYLYIMNTEDEYGICSIFDLDGNLVDQIEDGFEESYDSVYRMTTADQIVFQGETLTENGSTSKYHIINKSDIGKDQIPCHEAVFTT